MDDGKNDSQLRRKEQFLKRILPCFPPGRRRQPPKSTTMNGKVAPQQDVSTHCYFTRLNLKKMGPPYFCTQILQGIHRNPKQKYFFNSRKGFLMAALTGHGHPSPF